MEDKINKLQHATGKLWSDIENHFKEDNPDHIATVEKHALEVAKKSYAHAKMIHDVIVKGESLEREAPKSRKTKDTKKKKEIKSRISKAAEEVPSSSEVPDTGAVTSEPISRPSPFKVREPFYQAPVGPPANPISRDIPVEDHLDHAIHHVQQYQFHSDIFNKEPPGTFGASIAQSNMDYHGSELHRLAHISNSRKVLKNIASSGHDLSAKVAKRKLLKNRIPLSGVKLSESLDILRKSTDALSKEREQRDMETVERQTAYKKQKFKNLIKQPSGEEEPKKETKPTDYASEKKARFQAIFRK